MKQNGKTSRRMISSAAMGGVALASLGLGASLAMAEGSVTIASWGGSYQEAQDKAL